MPPVIVGQKGPFAGQRIPLGTAPVTFGRKSDSDIVIVSPIASRLHAEIVPEDGGFVLYDRNSSNGTEVNGEEVTRRVLRPNDVIRIGEETFAFELTDAMETLLDLSVKDASALPRAADPDTLRVTVTGGGPVGLAFALLLESAMGPRAAITVYDGRWTRDGAKVVWKTEAQGNVRRQQVVTVQSRQYLNLPEEVQERLFSPEEFSEMWPAGPDSINGFPPRNIRIAEIEDRLLEIANEKQDRIRLVPARFDITQKQRTLTDQHVLAICEGGRSRTREHFSDKFGTADANIYSLNGEHVQDVVLGLKVKSRLPDPMSVLLTVAQNRFLLNSLRGEGFLNMRLTDTEAKEVVGIDPVRQVFEECIASRPCVMARDEYGDFHCSTHSTLFLPALIKGSALWKQVREGLKFFDVPEADLSAVTAFRLDMVQRPRFTSRVFPPTADAPGTYGFLLGDAANAIHFWPGRGLNSGLASAISLARSLKSAWRGNRFRDADFLRHEAAMSVLQYRHKSRAWNAMVTTDDQGVTYAIKDQIARSLQAEAADGAEETREADIDALLQQLQEVGARLAPRMSGLPDEATLRTHLDTLQSGTLRTLRESGPWDTLIVGGEEVDIDIFYQPDPPAPKSPPRDPRNADLPPHATAR
ncbi:MULTISPECIES: FHA domain-containing protein [Streptacidiphilus]|uniref:FHA domain-containing protein n=1 Tax=Streptacidiphilus cavernicola TaxID=3342716 RepID=A0ABV6UIF3_9ACTN|nr:FHA domain-containing protein [Streptacidiphilus jeojiense]